MIWIVVLVGVVAVWVFIDHMKKHPEDFEGF